MYRNRDRMFCSTVKSIEEEKRESEEFLIEPVEGYRREGKSKEKQSP